MCVRKYLTGREDKRLLLGTRRKGLVMLWGRIREPRLEALSPTVWALPSVRLCSLQLSRETLALWEQHGMQKAVAGQQS